MSLCDILKKVFRKDKETLTEKEKHKLELYNSKLLANYEEVYYKGKWKSDYKKEVEWSLIEKGAIMIIPKTSKPYLAVIQRKNNLRDLKPFSKYIVKNSNKDSANKVSNNLNKKESITLRICK
ncbi:MAG: hypothetical protein LKF87_14540 [Clostridium tyrobutyricum]|jgi:hypothetical protein|uniref:hypothetical protein n=1 Tax=Clostridium tyrobutyricum TaxID=1519 RepID=UPI0011C7B96F|nr:hypothetical protein [Clostridium tyrobutyricum]MCH4200660.1 hypothetical protein [Clostridium tyrobutyricum]MCH4237558.1 hypothetical protein [Clostridium tyrobutyricum]MCH4260131.1 hypothetical protein [Clostridium tyrobutyricum]MCI2011759.1 hypothetical protein [Clostridium tyrobutyricum]